MLKHGSRQAIWAGEQSVELELQAVAFGPLARKLQKLSPGTVLRLSGFLMPSRRGARMLKLNITEWIEEP